MSNDPTQPPCGVFTPEGSKTFLTHFDRFLTHFDRAQRIRAIVKAPRCSASLLEPGADIAKKHSKSFDGSEPTASQQRCRCR